MSKKFLIALLSLVCILALALIVANPSEDRHLNAIVARFLAWRGEHARDCPKCQGDSIDENQLKLAILSDATPEGIDVGAGLHRRSYIFFSVMTKEGLADARTTGALGFVFGPTYKKPYHCLHKDIDRVELPRIQELSDFVHLVEISLNADRSCVYDGKKLTIEDLMSRLDAIENKEDTAVVVRADGEAHSVDVSFVTQWISSRGFGKLVVTGSRDEN